MSDSNSTLHNAIYSTVSPNGVDNVTCVEVSSLNFVHGQGNSTTFEEGCFAPSSNSSTASQCYAVTPQKGLLSVTKYVGIASTDAFPGQERETAVVAVSSAVQSGFSALMKEHRSAWGEIWDSADIVIPGEKQKALQLAVRASLFHLLSNVRKGSEPTGLGDTSIAPAGLTSDSYAGQVRELFMSRSGAVPDLIIDRSSGMQTPGCLIPSSHSFRNTQRTFSTTDIAI